MFPKIQGRSDPITFISRFLPEDLKNELPIVFRDNLAPWLKCQVSGMGLQLDFCWPGLLTRQDKWLMYVNIC